MLLLFLLLSQSLASPLPFTCSAGPLTLWVQPDLTYTVALHNLTLLDDGGFALLSSSPAHASPTWLTPASGLAPAAITPSTGMDAALGIFTALTLTWAATSPAWTTAFLCYHASDLLEFRATHPQGALYTPAQLPPPTPDPALYNFNASRAPSAHFPSFRLGPSAPVSALGHAQWAGEFAFHASNWNVSLEGFVSGQAGGPLVLHTPAFAPGAKPLAAVLGTLAGHKEAIAAIVPDPAGGAQLPMRWAAGPHAHLRALPPGHTGRMGLLAPRSAAALGAAAAAAAAAGSSGGLPSLYPGDTGITAAVYAYGAALRALGGTQRFPAEDDPGVSLLSCYTDNGAVYDGDFWAAPANAGRGGQVFPAWAAALAAAGIPAATLQLDPFWFSRGSPGNKDWAPSQEVFGAGGFEATRAAWPGGTTLYAYLWGAPCAQLAPAFQPYAFLQSPPLDNFMGGPFCRVNGSDSAAFHALLMARCKSLGCIGFELDFVDFNYLAWQEDMGVAGAWEAFLTGLSTAAARAGVPIQLCMPLPADVLMSAALPGVSTIRASEDDDLTYASGTRWRIGLTSLLHGALHVRPFQDAVWTHSCGQPGPYPAAYCQNATELGVAIGALSTGPLALGDAAGFSNATLLAGALAVNGVILKPSLPATPVDAWFNYGAQLQPPPQPPLQPLPRSPLQRVHAELWQAPSFIPLPPAPAQLRRVGRGGLGRFEARARAARAPPTPAPNTFPTPTPCPFLSLLAVDIPLALNFSLHPGDLTPTLDARAAAPLPSACTSALASGYLAMRSGLAGSSTCRHGALALSSGCVAPFTAQQPLLLGMAGVPSDPLLRGGPHAHEVLSLAPALLAQQGGNSSSSVQWVLLGEVGKFVAVSPVRFSGVLVEAGGGLLVAVEGAGGEVVAVRLLAPGGAAGGLHSATVFEAAMGPFPTGGDTLLLHCTGWGASAACSTSAM